MSGTTDLYGIGARIREERQRCGFSQSSFAELGGASRRVQAKWEKGTPLPTALTLAAWAQFGVDVAYIVTGHREAVAASFASAALAQAAPLETPIATIGSRFRAERKRLGLTIEGFAKLGDFSPRSVSDWEHDYAVPSIAVLSALAMSGVDALFIVTGGTQYCEHHLAPVDAGSPKLRTALEALDQLPSSARRQLLLTLLAQELAD